MNINFDILFFTLIMGFVEGMTEFLPVSSTGHLILANNLLNFQGTNAANFEIIIQIGAMFAVIYLYFQRFWSLLFPQKIDGKVAKFSGFYGLYMLFLTSLPASLLGLIFHQYIKMLFSVQSVLFFLVFGALCMLFAEKLQENRRIKLEQAKKLDNAKFLENYKEIDSIDKLTAKEALGIGFFQILALMPGFSRSASTIMGGMFFSLSRKTAAEYSFLAAVPIIVAAAGYEFFKSFDTFVKADISLFALGILFSFIFALIAVKFFISFVSRYSLKVFAYYRIIVAIVLYFYFF